MKTVVGWPRSGTHWLKALLERTTNEPWAHTHACPQDVRHPHVLIVRDPRDAFASHWRLYQHDQNPEQTQAAFLDFLLKGQGGPGRPWGMGWVAHTQRLIELNRQYPRRAPFVYYERLYARPEQVMHRVLYTMGERVAQEDISAAVIATKGKRCDPSTLGVDADMGRPGKGREQLEPSVLRALLDYCGPMMVRLGYIDEGTPPC